MPKNVIKEKCDCEGRAVTSRSKRLGSTIKIHLSFATKVEIIIWRWRQWQRRRLRRRQHLFKKWALPMNRKKTGYTTLWLSPTHSSLSLQFPMISPCVSFVSPCIPYGACALCVVCELYVLYLTLILCRSLCVWIRWLLFLITHFISGI